MYRSWCCIGTCTGDLWTLDSGSTFIDYFLDLVIFPSIFSCFFFPTQPIKEPAVANGGFTKRFTQQQFCLNSSSLPSASSARASASVKGGMYRCDPPHKYYRSNTTEHVPPHFFFCFDPSHLVAQQQQLTWAT